MAEEGKITTITSAPNELASIPPKDQKKKGGPGA